MGNVRTFIVAVALLSAFGIFFCFRSCQQGSDTRQKVVLAKQIHQVLTQMMADLRMAKASSIQGVPSDGQWHGQLSFAQVNGGIIEYRLDSNGFLWRHYQGQQQLMAKYIGIIQFRRMADQAHILELRVKAKNDASLVLNFKVRILE